MVTGRGPRAVRRAETLIELVDRLAPTCLLEKRLVPPMGLGKPVLLVVPEKGDGPIVCVVGWPPASMPRIAQNMWLVQSELAYLKRLLEWPTAEADMPVPC